MVMERETAVGDWTEKEVERVEYGWCVGACEREEPRREGERRGKRRERGQEERDREGARQNRWRRPRERTC